MRSRSGPSTDGLGRRLALAAGAAATLLAFLFAVRLLGAATSAAAPDLEQLLRRVAVTDAATLGASWLATYVLGSGTVVAALAISLFDAGALSPEQLYLAVAGSRLGGTAVVVFVGALDYLGHREESLRAAVSAGVLAFLLTHSIYLPATAVGYLWLRGGGGVGFDPASGATGSLPTVTTFEPLADAVATRLGPAASVLVAVALLFGCLWLLDSLLDRVETATLRDRVVRYFRRPWLAAAVGAVLTAGTTSVAFSLGVVVPLSNRGVVGRDELLPYVLGANVGTLTDTAVVAVLLGSPTGLGVVALQADVAAAFTTVALAALGPFRRVVFAVDDAVLGDRLAFGLFVASLVVVPAALVVLSLA